MEFKHFLHGPDGPKDGFKHDIDPPHETSVKDFLFWFHFSVNSAAGGHDEVTLLPTAAAPALPLRTTGLLAVCSDERWGASARRPIPLNAAHTHDFFNSKSYLRVWKCHPECAGRFASLNWLRRLEVCQLNSFPMANFDGWHLKIGVPSPQVAKDTFDQLRLSVAKTDKQPEVKTWCHGVSAINTGTGHCESIGIIAPLNENPLIGAIHERGANTPLGTAGNPLRPVDVVVAGKTSVLFKDNHPTNGIVTGYAAVAAGAFAPVSPKDYDFRMLARLNGAESKVEALSVLNEYLRWNRQQEKPENINPIDHPVEIAFFDGLHNTGLEAIH